MKKTLAFLSLIVAFVFIFSTISYSQEDEAKIIKLVEVENNKAISDSTVLSKIKTKEGESFSQELLNEDLKRLYALGFFEDVSIDIEDYEDGIKVTFIVKEKPLVEDISFSGNKIIKTAKLLAKMKTKPGDLLDESRLFRDINGLKDLYESRGYFQVDITYKTQINKRLNTARLTIMIREEERVRIKKIYIQGNESFSDKEILGLITTREAWLFRKGYYKEDSFREDLERIKSFYQQKGYLDVAVGDEFEYGPDGKYLYITIIIDEGKLYLTGDISIKGNKVISSSSLMDVLEMVTNEPFGENNMKMDAMAIQQLYYDKGYIMSSIIPAPLLNQRSGKIDVLYEIKENELIYIDKINIHGNTKTKDIVIRRELRVYPGEPFDGSKIRRSRERLNNLGFFEEVSFNTEDTKERNKKDLAVSVKESKTGEFSFGGGYSSVDKLVGFISVTQRNFDFLNFPTFTGDGQYLNLRAELGTVRDSYVLSWTEPWIFDNPLSFGFDLYNRGHERKGSVGYAYKESRTGGDLKLGKEFSEWVKGDLIYKLEKVDISDIVDDASSDLKDEEGDNVLSTLATYASHDTRDNVFNPTRGNHLSLGVEVAGGPFLGDKDFVKYILGNSTYFNFFEKMLILELKVRAGLVDAYGDSDKVPIYERFYAGGANTIRGYEERIVSPLDSSTNDPIGGESMFIGNIEATVPIYKDVLKGAVFYDVGNVWTSFSDFGSGSYKHGIGTGIRVKTPIGPLKLDLGYPLNDVEDQEQKTRLHFTMSRTF